MIRLDDPELRQSLEAVSRERQRLLTAHKDKPRVTLTDAVTIVLDRWHAAPGRMIVGLGGCPASGKTTAARELSRLIDARGRAAVHLPMDGYHFSNARLRASGLERIKGDRRTFDIAAYRDKLAEFKTRPGIRLAAPDYVRRIHDVVDDAITIAAETDVLVTEGIYVGFPRGGWEAVRSALDLLFYLDTPPQECVARVTARNREAGRDAATIRHKLRNDLGFMRASLEILGEADFVIAMSPGSEP